MNNKIKILEIVPNMQQGGLENLVMNILRYIDKEKFEIHFLYHYDGDYFFDDEIRNLGGIIHKCNIRNDNNLFKYLKYLNELFKNNQFDVVHSHMMSTSMFTMYYAKKFGVKIRINHAHNTTTEKSFKGFIKLLMIKLASKNANRFFACSDKTAKFAFKGKEYTVIDNCIEQDKFKYSDKKRKEIRDELKIADNEILFGNVGRMNVQKNQIFLIEAFAMSERKDCKLLIIGSGELENDINEKIREYDLQGKVIIRKNIGNIGDYYSAMDYFLLPSLFEGFPLTAIEAQTNGLPCVFSDKIDREVSFSNNNYYLSILEKKYWINMFKNIDRKRKYVDENKLKKYDVLNLKKIIEENYKG